jgi:hypothetical protein
VRAESDLYTDFKYSGDRYAGGKAYREIKSTRTIEKVSAIWVYYQFHVVMLDEFLPKTIYGNVRKYNRYFDMKDVKSKVPVNCLECDRVKDNRVVHNGYLTVYKCSGEIVDGPAITYYPDGKKIKSRRSYRDGRPDGSFVNYHDNGCMEEQYTITRGACSGMVERYDDTGNLILKIF